MTSTKTDKTAFRYIGKPVLRREGVPKLTGRSRYVDDLQTPGALHAKTIRTTIASGRISSITFPEGFPWEEFIIVDAHDLADNTVALIEDDQPVFCDEVVRHHREAVMVIAHHDSGLVHEAARAIRIEYEEEPGVFEIGEGPVLKELGIRYGDVDGILAQSDVILEGEYRTGAQEHVYIEPNGFIAWWEGDTVVLHGSHQCPYYVHTAVTRALALEDDKVRIIQETTGGGFGGKEDFPSLPAIHAALVSRKAGGKPVRLIYDRGEDLAASTKRHPSITRIRSGCTREGILKALEVEFLIDGGAYITLSPVVLSRGILHGFGPYRWEAANLTGKCHFTNSPPYGAFRGFGAPQSEFAIEMHLNRLARRLRIDPITLRRKNFLKKGDTLPTTQVLAEDPNLDGLMDRALELAEYDKRTAVTSENHGLGVAVSFHGTGFTGSGEVYLKSVVALEATAGGNVEIQVSSTEIGQGTETVFPQIVAETLGIPIEHITFRQPETGAVPNSGPTVASRTCSIVGGLVEKASRNLLEQLAGRTIADAVAAHGTLRATAQFQAPPWMIWNDETYQGAAYGAYSWCVNVAEVTVDPVTAIPNIDRLIGVFDIGRVINPTLAIGQVEGGMAQAAGWATCEYVVLREGVMQNASMTNYIIPTAVDIPELIADFVENPNPIGAYGAKGVGELPMDSPPAAIASAIANATGRDITHIPVRPEDLIGTLPP